METFLIRALQLIMSLSLLVIVHEGGHFLFARLFKVRVEKFYIFFDPWFSLFKFKSKNSHTEYGVGWIPLGGYVKIAGMIDESMDTQQMKQPAQPWEFRSKSAGQRLLIMIGGVLFNFILALFIYSMILLKWGDTYMSLDTMKDGLEYSPRAQTAGFRNGDLPLTADGKKLERINIDLLRNIVDADIVTVLREGKETQVFIPQDLSLLAISKDSVSFFSYRMPAVVDSVLPGKALAEAGMLKGDSLVAINGRPVRFWDEITGALAALQTADPASSTDNRNVTLAYVRNGITDTLTVRADENYKLGVLLPGDWTKYYQPKKREFGFFESFPAGIALGVNTLKGYVSDMKYVFTKEGANSLGGFATIGSIFPTQWDWHKFWSMTAFLSIILAFMNILPIPALDGGHVLFLLYEIITRRKPSDKFMEYAQMTGMVVLFGLLIWANFNDILRFLF